MGRWRHSLTGRLRLLTAFGAVYVIWGSTYLAIRIGIETIPPFLMAGSRFLLAGLPLLLWARHRGAPSPSARHWGSAALVGGLMLVGGNGLVTWAEQTVPSSITALLVTTVPLWMTLLDAIFYRGGRPEAWTWIGIVLGFAGVFVLVRPSEDTIRLVDPVGAVALIIASFAWANGSLLSRRVALPASASVAVGMEMITAGAFMVLLGTARGEWGALEFDQISSRSVIALLYLAIFGSIVSLSAYMYLLRTTTAAAVSTYAFVNPVVAVLLGWTVANEPIDSRTLFAGLLILTAVAVILWSWSRQDRRRLRGIPAGKQSRARGQLRS